MIIYTNEKQNRIEAVLKRPDPENPFKDYCQEYIVPDDFNIFVNYVNDAGENRIREMTAEEFESALSYREKRYADYPRVADQLDMIWHAMNSGEFPKIDTFYNSIKEIKDRYPKK